MVKNNKIAIYVSLIGLFIIAFAYTNCSPVHESADSSSVLPESVCSSDLAAVYSSVESTTSCAVCHTSGVSGAPIFKGTNFNEFLDVFSSGSDVRARTVTATNRVITRLRDGSDSTHPPQASYSTLESALNTALTNFDDCEATSAEVNGE